jgi:hypothetical protein
MFDDSDWRYSWYDGVDPTDAAFLANAYSYRTDAGGRLSAYMEVFDADATKLGEIGAWEDTLPDGFGVYRVEVNDAGEVVTMAAGDEVRDAFENATADVSDE